MRGVAILLPGVDALVFRRGGGGGGVGGGGEGMWPNGDSGEEVD